MADEHSLNSDLARILQKAGIKANPQIPFKYDKGDRRVADIVCYEVEGYKIGIEAKCGWGIKLSANKKASIAQADELVVNKANKHFCDASVAVIYPDSYQNQDHLANGEVKVAIRTPIDIRKQKAPQWKNCKVKDLPGLIKSVASQLGQPEELAKRAENAINEAFKKFNKEDVDSIMIKFVELMSDAGEAAKATNFKGLLVDLLTCFMFHTKLDETIPQYIHNHFRKKSDQPPTLAECLQGDAIAKFIDAYEKWLKVNYKDILEWNIRILSLLPAFPRSNDVVKDLARTAQSIQRAKGAHHHDVVGITFCNAISAAKQEGAMYTTLPAATMLTHLLFHKAAVHWENIEEVKKLRIVDFACGSGTLLIACANYILQNERTGNKEEVAKALLEQMLYGFDVNTRAIFQTATGLGTISPSIAFRKMQLHSLMYGVPKGETEARIGSLEMLRGMDDLVHNPPVIARKIDSPPAPIECDQFHLTIMNPPFTIEYKRHKQKDPKTEKKLRERESNLSTSSAVKLNSNAGNTNGFLALADKYLHPKTGKAAFILPAAVASNTASRNTRIWLAKQFYIKYIIVSYDPERIFFLR